MYAILFSVALLPNAEIKQKWSFPYTGRVEKGEVVIRDGKSWAREWKQVAHKNVVKVPPVPEIDFDTYMVVCTYWGIKPTGGYAVDIVKVRQGRLGTMITVRRTKPPEDGTTPQAQSSPACYAVVPKSGGKVLFILAR